MSPFNDAFGYEAYAAFEAFTDTQRNYHFAYVDLIMYHLTSAFAFSISPKSCCLLSIYIVCNAVEIFQVDHHNQSILSGSPSMRFLHRTADLTIDDWLPSMIMRDKGTTARAATSMHACNGVEKCSCCLATHVG